MTIGTHSKDKDSFYFGSARVYIADSLTYIDEILPILSSSNYPGAMGDVSLVIEKSFKEQMVFDENGIEVLKDVILMKESRTLNLSFLESSSSNMSMALNLLQQSSEFRIEILALYPNKVNKIVGVFPRVKVSTESIKLGLLQTENPLEIPLKLSVLATDNIVWTGNPYGSITII
jgi:hypothetical protein